MLSLLPEAFDRAIECFRVRGAKSLVWTYETAG
jgi:hypothetical protein